MEQRRSNALPMGAQIKLGTEECALDMGQKLNTNDAALKIAQVLLKREEFALGMVQRESANDAALKVAQINPNEEECAGDMVHTATITMNLQLSHRVMVQSLIRLL